MLASCTPDRYQEDFENDHALEGFEFSDPGAWQIVQKGKPGSALEFTGKGNYQPPVRSPHIIGMIADHRFGSFMLDVDLLQTGREYGHRDMCIYFGIQDSTRFYYVHLASRPDDHAHNIFIVDGAPRTKIAGDIAEGIDWGEELWHHIRLIRDLETGKIEVYFDNMKEAIMSADHKAFQKGYIGFGSFDDSGIIDNIRIQGEIFPSEKPGLFTDKTMNTNQKQGL